MNYSQQRCSRPTFGHFAEQKTTCQFLLLLDPPFQLRLHNTFRLRNRGGVLNYSECMTQVHVRHTDG